MSHVLRYLYISIHTPTKGVTDQLATKDGFLRDFNPHSHKGSDIVTEIIKAAVKDFNPHSHKGSDGRYHNHTKDHDHFNPHSHKGSDLFFALTVLQ